MKTAQELRALTYIDTGLTQALEDFASQAEAIALSGKCGFVFKPAEGMSQALEDTLRLPPYSYTVHRLPSMNGYYIHWAYTKR